MLPLLFAIPIFIAGIILLIKGSDILVEGTSKTALKYGIPVFIVSAVIIGFGTSSPELAVSVGAGLENNPDISLGNIVGSCIANLLLILGIAAVIKPVKINKCMKNEESIIVLLSSIILLLFAAIGLLDEYHLIGGVLFLLLFIGSLYIISRCAKQQKQNIEKIGIEKTRRNLLFIILGVVGVILGAWLLIESTVSIASALGVPSFFIALTVIAVGTSLPELMVTITASRKNESELMIGNIIGSNVYNIFLILGLSALLIPLHAYDALDLMVILLIATLGIFPFFYTGRMLTRRKGLIFLIGYVVFIGYSLLF